jgi:eukaryotic-like serine/threonine-protein kinase
VAEKQLVPKVVRFGVFEANLETAELRKQGIKLKLPPQSFKVLAMLLERPGELVSREDMQKRLWPADTFVDFDHSLNTAINKIREVLADNPETPHFIETIPRKGYRFVGVAAEAQTPTHTSRTPARPVNAAVPHPRDLLTASVRTPDNAIHWRVIATLTLFVGMLGVAAFFYFHRRPLLTEKDTIVVADFANTTGDSVFDSTLRQGLAVQLEQSPFLTLASDDRIRQTLRLMAQPGDARLTPELAREVCQRSNATVAIDGSIAPLEKEYVLGLHAINCQSGDTLAQEQVTSQDKLHVLAALGNAARELRQKLGESRGTIHQFDTPIEQATTPSLDALKAYSLGVKTLTEHGEVPAIPFFKRAIELDPSFALAYATLGRTYIDLGEPSLTAENLQKAYDLRQRVTDREKFQITAIYYTGVTGELEKANQTADLWARTYPRDLLPHQLLGFNYECLGQYENAIAENLNGLRLNPDVALLHSNLMEDYTPLNRFEEAKSTYRHAVERKLESPYLHADLYVIAFLENDPAEMQRQITLAKGMPGGEDWLFSLQSDTAAYSGQLAKAREFSRQAVASALRADLREVAANWHMNGAVREVEFGNFQEARWEVKQGLALAQSRDAQTVAALVLARAGEAQQAQSMADDLAKNFPVNTQLKDYWLPSIRAAIEIDRHHPAEAIKILEETEAYELGYPQPQLEGGSLLYPAYLRGQAYLQLRQSKEAAGEFQKFLDHRAAVVNCPLGALAHLWLGHAYTLQGDIVKAKAAYQDFFSLWKDGDPDIPILKQAKAEYAKLK